MSIGARLKKLRKKLNLTQKEFAAKIPGRGKGTYNYSYIAKIETGHTDPSVKYLKKIGETFNMPPRYFFQDEEPKSFDINELRGEKVKALICLAGHYRCELGHFRKCRGCKLKELCDKVKRAILEDTQEKGEGK